VNGSGLARFGIGVAVAMCALPGVASAETPVQSARSQTFTPVLNPTGALTFTWHGSASRGCQAAGVCGVSGSLEVIPQDQSGGSESPPSRRFEISDEGAVVRVTDPGSMPDAPHVCTDLVAIDLSFSIERAKHGRLVAMNEGPGPSPSSGRCAGPLASDLDNFDLPARRLASPTEAYSLAAKRTFGAGPYEVTVTSTIRASRSRATGIGSPFGFGIGIGGGVAPKPKHVLLESVSLLYRLSIGGSLTTSFVGRPDPLCAPLDACGVSGSVTDSFSQNSTPGHAPGLEIDAQRVVHHAVSRAQALADLRSGRLAIEPSGEPLVYLASARVSFSDGSLCTDQLAQGDGIDLNVDTIDHRHRVSFELSPDLDMGDPLRTHCPGPSDLDAPPNARASTLIGTLGDHSLRLVLPATGKFVASSYAGALGGSASIDLVLERVKAGTEHTTVFPGES
jgi:hypothetical protein